MDIWLSREESQFPIGNLQGIFDISSPFTHPFPEEELSIHGKQECSCFEHRFPKHFLFILHIVHSYLCYPWPNRDFSFHTERVSFEGETGYPVFASGSSMTRQMNCLFWFPGRGGLTFPQSILTFSSSLEPSSATTFSQPLPMASRDHFLKPATNTFPNTTNACLGIRFLS